MMQNSLQHGQRILKEGLYSIFKPMGLYLGERLLTERTLRSSLRRVISGIGEVFSEFYRVLLTLLF